MPDKSAIAKKILKGLAVGTLAGGSGYLGYKVGENRGAIKASNRMSEAFSAANALENQQIAEEYYNQGLEEALSKKSSFEEIKKRACVDELEKIGINFSALKSIAKGFSSVGKVTNTNPGYAGSFKNLWSGIKGVGSGLKKGFSGGSAGGVSSKGFQDVGASAARTWQTAKPALATAGASAVGLGLLSAQRKPKVTINNYR